MTADKARKYAGKVKIGGGPVPIQKWTDRDRTSSSTKGDAMRGEIKSKGNK